MNKIKIALLSIISVLFVFVFTMPTVAAPTVAATDCAGGNARACLDNGTSSGKIMNYLDVGLNILSGAVGVLAVIMLIVGGIQYSASNGDPSAVTAAKKKIGNVLLGLVAYVFLYAFLQWLIPGGIY